MDLIADTQQAPSISSLSLSTTYPLVSTTALTSDRLTHHSRCNIAGAPQTITRIVPHMSPARGELLRSRQNHEVSTVLMETTTSEFSAGKASSKMPTGKAAPPAKVTADTHVDTPPSSAVARVCLNIFGG